MSREASFVEAESKGREQECLDAELEVVTCC